MGIFDGLFNIDVFAEQKRQLNDIVNPVLKWNRVSHTGSAQYTIPIEPNIMRVYISISVSNTNRGSHPGLILQDYSTGIGKTLAVMPSGEKGHQAGDPGDAMGRTLKPFVLAYPHTLQVIDHDWVVADSLQIDYIYYDVYYYNR